MISFICSSEWNNSSLWLHIRHTVYHQCIFIVQRSKCIFIINKLLLFLLWARLFCRNSALLSPSVTYSNNFICNSSLIIVSTCCTIWVQFKHQRLKLLLPIFFLCAIMTCQLLMHDQISLFFFSFFFLWSRTYRIKKINMIYYRYFKYNVSSLLNITNILFCWK